MSSGCGLLTVAKLTSLTAYAKHRGITVQSVSRAVKDGRLTKSVTYDARGKPKIADVELADQEWAASTQMRVPPLLAESSPEPPQEHPHNGDTDRHQHGIDYQEARRRVEVHKARSAQVKADIDELQLATRKGELVEASEAVARVEDAFMRVRTRLLAVPSRCRQRIPHLDGDDVEEIEVLIREALEELSAEAEEEEESDDGA